VYLGTQKLAFTSKSQFYLLFLLYTMYEKVKIDERYYR